jgi:hypothetical protein
MNEKPPLITWFAARLLIGVILVGVLIVSVPLGIRYWWASWQGDVWRRQGVQISNAEVFFGIRPAGMPAQ